MVQRNHRSAASRPSIYQTVTDRILSSLKTGVIPWEKPWKLPRFTGGPFPRNFYTGKPYPLLPLPAIDRVLSAKRSEPHL